MSTPKIERGIVFGTERTSALLERLDRVDDELKFIHIAGTNGKGSLAEYFTEILIANGERVGTFTSPEVFDYFDQFKVNGKQIAKDRMTSYLEYIRSINAEIGATPFEVETAAAIYAFKKEGCSWCVLECGMGGKLDATNAINKKELAVISSISLEHTDFLGSTLTEICQHKSGIIKGKCVVNPLQCRQVLEYFKGLNGVTFAEDTQKIDEHRFIYRGEQYEITSSGDEQFSNAATAIEGALLLGFKLEAIKSGLRAATLLGRRQEITSQGRVYVLDGGHNAESLKYLATYILNSHMDIEVIYGSLSDKDLAANFRELSRAIGKINLVECPSNRAMPLEEMLAAARENFKQVRTFSNLQTALGEVEAKRVIICGSFTLLKEALRWIEKRQ